jgi:hypothetical protein
LIARSTISAELSKWSIRKKPGLQRAKERGRRGMPASHPAIVAVLALLTAL